jgi:hypothetical protein
MLGSVRLYGSLFWAIRRLPDTAFLSLINGFTRGFREFKRCLPSGEADRVRNDRALEFDRRRRQKTHCNFNQVVLNGPWQKKMPFQVSRTGHMGKSVRRNHVIPAGGLAVRHTETAKSKSVVQLSSVWPADLALEGCRSDAANISCTAWNCNNNHIL